jgi:hypothetical protein
MLSKRNVLMINEAMDMAEGFVSEAAELLEQANIVATVAIEIVDIPRYLDERLICLINNIERIDCVRRTIKAVRESLADGAVKDERRRRESSRQPSLVA